MAADFTANFLEDNFLSDQDWGANGISVPPWETTTSSDAPSFVQHESGSNFSDFEIKDLINGLESPPLTPPEEAMQLYFDATLSSEKLIEVNGITSCEDFLADTSADRQYYCRKYYTKDAPTSLSSRFRSGSDASSSTSAYSSQSVTPPPLKSSVDIFESAFYNEVTVESNSMETPSHDDGFHENPTKSSIDAMSSISSVAPSAYVDYAKPPMSKSKTRKQRAPKRIAQINASDEEESDFDRQVREALKETNRLLNLHNGKNSEEISNQPADTLQQNNNCSPHVDLRQLCDNTILRSTSSDLPYSNTTVSVNSQKRQQADNAIIKDLKRKAAEKLKAQSKKPLLVQSGIGGATVQPAKTQTHQIPFGNSFQVPLACTGTNNHQAPVKIIVKQESSPNLFITSTSSCNTTPITIIQPSNQTMQISGTSCRVVTEKPVFAQNQDEIPLSSIVIKPDNSQTAIPISSLNITSNLTAKPVYQKPTTKPLMVSQPAKTTIVPNGNTSLPSNILRSGLGLPLRKDMNETLEKNSLDPPPSLNDLDKETQNRVMKRQQRMIKNREAACQSRQRRKAYITMLEQRMNECLEDNNKLRSLNASLQQRINQLEKENASLRTMNASSSASQKKAACILMLLFFVVFNINPLHFLSGQGITNEITMIAINSSKAEGSWSEPVQASYHGRQLLGLEEQDVKNEKSQLTMPARSEMSLSAMRDEQAFWIDDMVKDYMRKHFSRILELSHGTSSISLQRLLRRKLKEELSVRLPTSTAKTKRIAYSPRALSERRAFRRGQSSHETSQNDVEMPPSPPNVQRGRHTEPPCGHSSGRTTQLNETESIRIKDNLSKWIEQHKVEQQNNKKSLKKTQDNPSRNARRKRRNSSYSSSRPKLQSSIPAVYEKRDEKMKKLLDAIDRKNDTVYMISFNKDHILLPAMMLNASGHTKMSLVFPTLPPNDSFATADEQTMIQINCEVVSTSYLKVDTSVLPSGQYATHTDDYDKEEWKVHTHKHENPKLHAFHGSNSHQDKRKASLVKSKKPSELHDDDATVTDDVDL